MYAATYKQVPIGDTFGLLRKAERLERLMPSLPDDEPAKALNGTTRPICTKCGIDVTPMWHDLPFKIASVPRTNGVIANGDANGHVKRETPAGPGHAKVCHQCHFGAMQA